MCRPFHLDRGYDANTVRDMLAGYDLTDAIIARKRRRGEPKPAGNPLRLGLRWAVERTRRNHPAEVRKEKPDP